MPGQGAVHRVDRRASPAPVVLGVLLGARRTTDAQVSHPRAPVDVADGAEPAVGHGGHPAGVVGGEPVAGRQGDGLPADVRRARRAAGDELDLARGQRRPFGQGDPCRAVPTVLAAYGGGLGSRSYVDAGLAEPSATSSPAKCTARWYVRSHAGATWASCRRAARPP
ncbi:MULTISPECIES: hypothetical protein [unclassified Streptomyces]|uniref:hypothetical protein n=1 Tax=unclassified Streptomyces TaxID=2593676 RepID=UPI00131EBC90|nr:MULTISPECIES: hypothetical protein [unclassified Streptomyces]